MEHRPPGGRPAGAGIGGGGDLHRCSGKPLETMGRKATELRRIVNAHGRSFMGRLLPMNALCPPGCEHEQTTGNRGTQSFGG